MSGNSLTNTKAVGVADKAAPMFNASVRVKLLNTSLDAVYQYSETDEKTRTRMLVMPSDEENTTMTLEEIAEAINDMIKKIIGVEGGFSIDDLKPVLAQFGLDTVLQLTIRLKQVFFYSDSTTTSSPDISSTAEGTTESTMEYAICIEIIEPLVPKSPELKKLFSVEKLSFAIWNTNRKKILDKMQLGSIDDLLN